MTDVPLTRRALLKITAALVMAADDRAIGAPVPGSIIDLMPDFWRVYDPVAKAPIKDQSSALTQGFFQVHKVLFARAGIHHTDAELIEGWLGKVSPMIPAIRRLHRRFANDYGAYVRRFLGSFPDFDKAAAPTFLIPSLFHFDAHLEPSDGQLPLFFGMDGIVKYHGENANLSVLFSHETYHCYQSQKSPSVMLADKVPLFAGLWVEGGATWVSEKLNPNASILNVLLDDKALAAMTRDQIKIAANALLMKFDSTDEADAATFFSAGWTGPWPARSGYLFGLHIARRIAPTLTSANFASLPLGDMRPLYAARVAAIADSGNLDA
jgi:hypothetical protein